MRGYDDVAFENGNVYLSYTNPVGTGNAIILQLTNPTDPPQGELTTRPILRVGALGLNLEDGKIEPVMPTDPDSLKVAPNGDLLLSSSSDDIIIDVHNPGKHGRHHQTVSFTTILNATGDLDDVIKVNAHKGTFYLADTADNRVLVFHATHLKLKDYYASVGNAFGEIDPHTGLFTALVQAEPGFSFGKAHGAEFVADNNAVSDPGALVTAHEAHIHGVHTDHLAGLLLV
jgi:hypothetical protein